MKYKILLTGTNQVLLSDFFYHMEFTFECMSSSERVDDLMCHLKYFKPNAMVICLNRETKQELSSLRGVVQRLSADEIPLMIVGEEEACNLFESILPGAADLTVKKPFTTKLLEERVSAYLNKHVADKEKEKKRLEELEREADGVAAVPKAMEKNEQELQNTLAMINQAAEELEEPKKKHILVVDDDSSVLKLVKKFLGGRYNVATAINGKVAMKFLEKKDTDMILLDYEMPGENGAQVLQKLRDNEKTAGLPVVFLTGLREKERIQEVLALGPQGYLLKPINMQRLSDTVKEILGE